MSDTINQKPLKKGEDYTGITVTYACHDGNGKYLLAKRSKNCRDEHGAWDFGGGGLEFGDTVEDTLRKEIKEEYCAEVQKFEFMGYRDVHRTHEGRPTHWIALDFKVRINPNEARNGEPDKFDALEWFTLDNLPDTLHSQIPNYLEKYKSFFEC